MKEKLRKIRGKKINKSVTFLYEIRKLQHNFMKSTTFYTKDTKYSELKYRSKE